MKKAQAEIDSVLGQRRITIESIKKLEYVVVLHETPIAIVKSLSGVLLLLCYAAQ